MSDDLKELKRDLEGFVGRLGPNVAAPVWISDVLSLIAQLEQAKADAARYKKEARTYQQIQRACGDLPDGWEIHICLEKDAGWVDLISPDGERTAVDTDHDDISYTIGDAIDAAIQSQEVDSSPKGVKS